MLNASLSGVNSPYSAALRRDVPFTQEIIDASIMTQTSDMIDERNNIL